MREPAAMSQGIDVSEWQGRVDWPAVALAGVDFAVVRAAYGLHHPDLTFADNWAAVANVHLLRGGYMWFKASQNPIDQADYFAAAMGPLGPDDLAPWADFEREPGESDSTIDGRPPREALGRLAVFLDELEHRTGHIPTIYTGPAFWRSIPGSNDPHWARYPLAIAHYTNAVRPDVPLPWGDFTYWQHSSAGNVPGIPGNVDLDISLVNLLTSRPGTPKEHPYMGLNAPVVTVVASPTGGGYWEVAADGGVFAFGDATPIDNGGLVEKKLVAPITGAAATRSGEGLWLCAGDGGIFALGDAVFKGHAG